MDGKSGEIMKKYTIEKLDMATLIFGVILLLIDAKKSIPFVEIWEGMILFLAFCVFPWILIVRFLMDPKEGKGFAANRSENGSTEFCIAIGAIGLLEILRVQGSIWNLAVAAIIFVVCLEVLNRYLWNKMSRIFIDENVKERKNGAQVIISLYFAFFLNVVYLILKWVLDFI